MDRPIPTVRFLCGHNPAHSQMALGFFEHLAYGRAVAWVADEDPGRRPAPAVVAAMAEVGIDIGPKSSRPSITPIAQIADVVVATTCDDHNEVFLGQRYEDWKLADAAGPIAAVRPVRDEIERQVRSLIRSLDLERASA